MAAGRAGGGVAAGARLLAFWLLGVRFALGAAVFALRFAPFVLRGAFALLALRFPFAARLAFALFALLLLLAFLLFALFAFLFLFFCERFWF